MNQNSKDNSMGFMKKNLIKQQYLSSKTNHVICIDITQLGHYGSCFVAMDLAARNIVGHCYKEKHLIVQDIIDSLAAIIEQRSFLPKIHIIHSDRESYFKNNQYYDFLDQHQIKISRGSTKGHDNQVIERTFRTLKDILRKQLQPNWELDPLTQKGFSISEIDNALQAAIELYNNKPHKSLYYMTPNYMEEALFQENNKEQSSRENNSSSNYDHENNDCKQIALLAPNNNSKEALEIVEYKQLATQNYAVNGAKFFTEFRKESNVKLDNIVEQNTNLYRQNLSLQKTLHTVEKEIEIMREKRIKSEQRKQKRENAKKQLLRDSILPHEFEYILSLVKINGFVSARKRTAYLLLYVTGLRVSNLLNLTVNHINELLTKGKTCVSLIKEGASRHMIILGPQAKKQLNNHLPDFSQLMQHKEGNQPFFTTQTQLDKPIDRSSFDNELNLVLKKASLVLHKHIRTHSFRATLITELLESTPIHIVQEVIGHRSIKTTLQYNRNKIDEKQFIKIMHNLDRKRGEKPLLCA